MAMLADLLKSLVTDLANSPTYWPQRNDMRMELPPMDGEGAGKIMHPDQMQTQMETPPPGTISDDSGKLVDFNFDSNPFKKLLETNNGQGSISGLLNKLFMQDQPLMDRSGTTPRMGGTGDPKHVPGTGEDAVLSQTPIRDQRQRSMQMEEAALPPPPDYSQPTALDPQSIEELRLSLLTQSGMLDPGNPNGLSARMASPNSAADMRAQVDEMNAITDAVRGPIEEDRIRRSKRTQR